MHVNYERPPIVEALIDIQIEPQAGSDILEVDKRLTELLPDYPHKKKTESVKGRFDVDQEPTASVEKSRVGSVFLSTDKKQILQVQLDRFTFSRLAPYRAWEDLKSEANRLWDIFQSVNSSKRIGRVAVRYINRLDFPSGTVEFSDYLKTHPSISTEAPDMASGFFMRLELPQPDINASVVLILTSVPIPAGPVSMILDLDVFTVVDQPG